MNKRLMPLLIAAIVCQCSTAAFAGTATPMASPTPLASPAPPAAKADQTQKWVLIGSAVLFVVLLFSDHGSACGSNAAANDQDDLNDFKLRKPTGFALNVRI